jgi:hypothetical protein
MANLVLHAVNENASGDQGLFGRVPLDQVMLTTKAWQARECAIKIGVR